jgi:precorrin-3B synthase
MSAQPRGLCPSLIDPLPTGDGLLARWVPLAPLSIDSFVELCEAAERDGNGVIEVTQRGSLQFRGLSHATAARFSDTVGSLGASSNVAPPIWTAPLLGLDPAAALDLRNWIPAWRAALSAQFLPESINPKVSVLVDDGGALHLDEISADLRLRAGNGSTLHVSIGGTAASATALGWTRLERAAEVIIGVLTHLVAHGRTARARDFRRDVDVLRSRLCIERIEAPGPTPRGRPEPLAAHSLNFGRIARGVAPAFGFSHAAHLKMLAEIARSCGADALRPAPDRALLALGILRHRALEFATKAEAAGFVVSPEDTRRHVVACAGAPACSSARMPTRELAPLVANALHGLVKDDSTVVHLSGCAKGCAHPRRATLVLVGPDRLVVDGRADNTAVGHMAPSEFIARVPDLVRGALRR